MRSHVLAQSLQEFPQRRDLGVIQALVQLAIKGGHNLAQAVEHLLSRRGEFDNVDSPVCRVTSPREQALSLHAVEVVGKRGALDADLGSDLPLIRLRLLLESNQDEPERT